MVHGLVDLFSKEVILSSISSFDIISNYKIYDCDFLTISSVNFQVVYFDKYCQFIKLPIVTWKLSFSLFL